MKNEIEILIGKFFSSELSAEERKTLDLWITEPDNEALFDDIKKAFELTGKLNFNTVVDVEQSWNEFQVIRESESLPKSNSYNILKLVVAVSSVAAILLLLLVLFKGQFNNSPLIYATEDKIQKIFLPDSSTVWLNKNSELVIDEGFAKNNRNLTLKGEAFFKVVKSDVPFEITTGDIKTRVLGTQFNLSAYSNNEEIELYVHSGLVAFNSGAESEVVVSKQGKAKYNKKTAQTKLDTVSSANNISWLNGKLAFDNTALAETFHYISKYYGKVIIVAQDVDSIKFTGFFTQPILNDLLEVVTLSTETKYEIKGDSIFISPKIK